MCLYERESEEGEWFFENWSRAECLRVGGCRKKLGRVESFLIVFLGNLL